MSNNKAFPSETHPSLQPTSGTAQPLTCEYHTQVLGMVTEESAKNLDPMERFLAEGPAEQSALFIRSDTGKPSTAKGCTCGEYN